MIPNTFQNELFKLNQRILDGLSKEKKSPFLFLPNNNNRVNFNDEVYFGNKYGEKINRKQNTRRK